MRQSRALALIGVLSFAVFAVPLSALARAAEPSARPAAGNEFPLEEVHDTYAGLDEAVTNLRLANHRWPDCYDDASAIADIFRIDGVADKGGQDKALALWKWFRILVSGIGGGYPYETDVDGEESLIVDPHKTLTVYGHHMCDGQSWAMTQLWRAAGYIAFDQCHYGHTIVSLRYQDVDGAWRFHDFDPMFRFYYWDAAAQRVGTWTMPLLRGQVHRHLFAPQQVHTLRTSLRLGESLDRLWDNEGHVLQTEKQPKEIVLGPDYQYRPGRTDGVFGAAGQETQTFVADLTPERWADALWDGSTNTACSPAAGKAILHPAKKGEPAAFVYRLPSPYVALDAVVEAELVKGDVADTCRLLLSINHGKSWRPIFTLEKPGVRKVTIPLGREARTKDLPHVYGSFEFLLKAEFGSAADAEKVGMNSFRIVAYRECNKRTLPNLMPGENVFRVTADKLAKGLALEATVEYSVNGEARSKSAVIHTLPFYFKIDTGDVRETWEKNYDQRFNVGAVRMKAIRFCLLPSGGKVADKSLPPEEAEPKFKQACPHPADMTARKEVAIRETDPMQTSGFFPQSTKVQRDPAAMAVLIATLRTHDGVKSWNAAEDLGNYPDALDALLRELPKADGDLTLYLCKALAQIKDPKAAKPLLRMWKDVPSGAPGTRYIPDVLAAIGDRSVVPALAAPLRRLRFDYRFHIVQALGLLGGPQAEEALRDLAANDPFPAVRQLSAEMLKTLPK
jgi:hypothetical protein